MHLGLLYELVLGLGNVFVRTDTQTMRERERHSFILTSGEGGFCDVFVILEDGSGLIFSFSFFTS